MFFLLAFQRIFFGKLNEKYSDMPDINDLNYSLLPCWLLPYSLVYGQFLILMLLHHYGCNHKPCSYFGDLRWYLVVNNLQSLSYFYPELLLTVLVIAAIIYDLFLDSSKSDRVGWLLIFGLTIIITILFFQDDTKITTLFSDAIVLDPFSTFFKIVIVFSTILFL